MHQLHVQIVLKLFSSPVIYRQKWPRPSAASFMLQGEHQLVMNA